MGLLSSQHRFICQENCQKFKKRNFELNLWKFESRENYFTHGPWAPEHSLRNTRFYFCENIRIDSEIHEEEPSEVAKERKLPSMEKLRNGFRKRVEKIIKKNF